MSRVRFHFDEQVNPVVAAALRRYGADATTTVEAGLRTTSDSAQWDFAQREGRAIVTTMPTFPAAPATTRTTPALHTARRTRAPSGRWWTV